ncbi:hypothetical protein ACJZ2D_011390 [Fusarium nematophilum]
MSVPTPATPGAGPTISTSKAPTSNGRRRARKACIGCRVRKVRCDVTMHGLPCTNCQLDYKTCVVKDRASKRQLPIKQGMQQVVFDSLCIPSSAEENDHGPPNWGPSPELFDELGGNADVGPPPSIEPGQDSQFLEGVSSGAGGPKSDRGGSPSHISNVTQCSNTAASAFDPIDQGAAFSLQQGLTSAESTPGAMMVPYSSYPFLTINNLADLSSQDLAFLEIKGALHVPVKPMLDEFVRQYFLHVHPTLPLLDEAQFWSAYRQDKPADPQAKIPLLVFQAMIFASCSFVPETVTKALGHDRIRAARSTFYHNTKLLHDLGIEKSPVVIAQTAVLMTLWCPAEVQPRPENSAWLQTAIDHAQFVDAHRAWEPSAGLPHEGAQSEYGPHMLRRLWSCCLVRDRFLSVGLRRIVQITKLQPTIITADFDDEIGGSEVHNAETKQLLARIFVRLTSLCNILTDILLVVSPSDDHPGLEHEAKRTLIESRAKLREWYDETELEISTAIGSSGVRQHPVIVSMNLMYIFYYASQSHISRQGVLLSCYQPRTPNPLDPSRNYEHSREVQDAAIGTVECLKELIQLDLIRYLPLSAVAFIAIPLLFHILDAKFLYPDKLTADLKARHRRLRVLINTLKEYRPRYDGMEWFSYALRYVVNLAQFHSTSLSKGSVASWTDLLTQEPSFCLRLTLTIDLSLSRSKIPEDQDFPMALRGVLRPKIGLIRELALEEPSPSKRQRETSLHHIDLELEAGSLKDPRPSECSSQQRQSYPQPQISEDVPKESSLATAEEGPVEMDEQAVLEGLISPFPVVTEPSKNNDQESNPVDPALYQLLSEPLSPLASYDAMMVDGCDFDSFMYPELVDASV